ncbi:MAG: ATP-binding protein [Candidatus Yonathbacteria bacterium]|nr:ATP-binding protein [Candidatus Yonathbacteria bacterium]
MQGKNKPFLRYLDTEIRSGIAKKHSALILGPRQVGKTTLVQDILAKVQNKADYLLQNPAVRIALETDPARVIREVEALVGTPIIFVDEAQKVPEVFDAAQLLIDKKKAAFIFTGSSARKLKRSGVNLLPGRIKRFHLDPLLWGELGFIQGSTIPALAMKNINEQRAFAFHESLIFGALPGIITLPKKEREDFLRSYTQIYLEEEIRAEALARKIGAFSQFLELAAAESGTSPNITKLSNESGVSQPALKEFYQILEDTLVVERVEPYRKNARKRILSSSRFYFFDIGVRNALARLPLSDNTVNAQKGILFEHAVMLEIIRRVRALNKNYRVCFWRTSGGAEVDCVVDLGTSVIPIEIKASRIVSPSEIKGLKNFLVDYKNIATEGYVITLGDKKEKLAENITALPWFHL